MDCGSGTRPLNASAAVDRGRSAPNMPIVGAGKGLPSDLFAVSNKVYTRIIDGFHRKGASDGPAGVTRESISGTDAGIVLRYAIVTYVS